jgi:hypothetical protein
MKRLAVVVLMASSTLACSREPQPPPMAPPEIAPGKLDPLYRSMKAIEAATSVGVTYIKFGELIQSAATELSIAKDKAAADPEKQMIESFGNVLKTYSDSATIWKMKNDDTGDKPWHPGIIVGLIGSEGTAENIRNAALVTKYNLPTQEGRIGTLGYRKIPDNSAQLIWGVASSELATAVAKYMDMQQSKPLAKAGS